LQKDTEMKFDVLVELVSALLTQLPWTHHCRQCPGQWSVLVAIAANGDA
jgi:hypothetical protein